MRKRFSLSKWKISLLCLELGALDCQGHCLVIAYPFLKSQGQESETTDPSHSADVSQRMQFLG